MAWILAHSPDAFASVGSESSPGTKLVTIIKTKGTSDSAASASISTSGSATTDANGEATFCYSAALPGEDVIHAFAVPSLWFKLDAAP
mgnify:CR=1 FL=1